MNKLEEAAAKYADSIYNKIKAGNPEYSAYDEGFLKGIYYCAKEFFMDGAKWQEEQSAGKEQDSMLAASLIGADLAKPKWISVKDKQPKVDEKVLVINDGNIEISSCFERFDGKAEWDVDYPHLIKYWMPIPELPKGGEK